MGSVLFAHYLGSRKAGEAPPGEPLGPQSGRRNLWFEYSTSQLVQGMASSAAVRPMPDLALSRSILANDQQQ
jgi:hypothetical protein